MGAISRAVKRVCFEIHPATSVRAGRDFNERPWGYTLTGRFFNTFSSQYTHIIIQYYTQTGVCSCDWLVHSRIVCELHWANMKTKKNKRFFFFYTHTATHKYIYNIKTLGQKNDKYCGSINISALNNGSSVSIIIIWLYRVSPRI